MKVSTLAVASILALGLASPLATAASCSAAWAQCGGSGWSGSTCCEDGYVCVRTSEWFSMCEPSDIAPTTSPLPTASTTSPPPSKPYTTYVDITVPAHSQVYPTATQDQCGMLTLVDNVCCPPYCSNDNRSDSCGGCTGQCTTPRSSTCTSGTNWGEQTTVTSNEKWHFSRSTHYGLTTGGACGFGLYALCTKGSKTASWTDPMLGSFSCDAFCSAYPVLCQDPSNVTLRGNFAAPNGGYYSQFWPHLEGTRDNYLSCGECFEVIKTKKDGTDYQPGEAGYTDPVVLEVTDSCPCDANSKWCCGSGDDHCAEIDFKYGCPIPKDSTHLDLSDIAMGRLQGGGKVTDGVIPTRYRRVPCPKPGNIYVWMQKAGPYYFAFGIVNTAGVGGVAKVEVRGKGQTKWTALEHNPDYLSAHPQERYGTWTIPRSISTPFNVPVGMRITSPNGEQVVNENAITTFTPPASAPTGAWYLDFGTQFTMTGKA